MGPGAGAFSDRTQRADHDLEHASPTIEKEERSAAMPARLVGPVPGSEGGVSSAKGGPRRPEWTPEISPESASSQI